MYTNKWNTKHKPITGLMSGGSAVYRNNEP